MAAKRSGGFMPSGCQGAAKNQNHRLTNPNPNRTHLARLLRFNRHLNSLVVVNDVDS